MSTHPPQLTDAAIERLRAVADALLCEPHSDEQFSRGVRSAAYNMLKEGGWNKARAEHLIAALTPTPNERSNRRAACGTSG